VSVYMHMLPASHYYPVGHTLFTVLWHSLLLFSSPCRLLYYYYICVLWTNEEKQIEKVGDKASASRCMPIYSAAD